MTTTNHARPEAYVLYVEDDDNDVFLMQRAFRKAGIERRLEIAGDARVALNRLSEEALASGGLPCLIIADLNMPGFSGLELLKRLRTLQRLAGTPIVVMTSSNQERDIRAAYAAGANAFIVKPASPDRLIEIVTGLAQVWNLDPAEAAWQALPSNIPAPTDGAR